MSPISAQSLHPISSKERGDTHRELLNETLDDEDLAANRADLQQQRAYGHDNFKARVEAKTNRFAGVRPAHRPARNRVDRG